MNKYSIIELLDIFMSGDANKLMSILKEYYENFRVFYNIYSTLENYPIGRMSYETDGGFIVHLQPMNDSDYDEIVSIIQQNDYANSDQVDMILESCSDTHSPIEINISIRGDVNESMAIGH